MNTAKYLRRSNLYAVEPALSLTGNEHIAVIPVYDENAAIAARCVPYSGRSILNAGLIELSIDSPPLWWQHGFSKTHLLIPSNLRKLKN